MMVRQVYWQVADARRRAPERLVSSRSTQVGKEDFLYYCHHPNVSRGVMVVGKGWRVLVITYHDQKMYMLI